MFLSSVRRLLLPGRLVLLSAGMAMNYVRVYTGFLSPRGWPSIARIFGSSGNNTHRLQNFFSVVRVWRRSPLKQVRWGRDKSEVVMGGLCKDIQKRYTICDDLYLKDLYIYRTIVNLLTCGIRCSVSTLVRAKSERTCVMVRSCF